MKSKLQKLNEVYKYLRSIGKTHTQREFAEQLKTTKTGLSSAFSGNERYLTANLFKKIYIAYPDVFNKNYLLGDDDEMLRGSVPTKTKNEICLYDVSASAGYGSFDEVIKSENIIAKYTIPDFRDIDFMIYVKGSSMYPKYSSGDIIACRILRESRFIQWGKVYVVATREQGLLVKRLEESQKENHITAISDNPSYKPFDIPQDEIWCIALVVGVLRLE